jgi:hypothetical protein
MLHIYVYVNVNFWFFFTGVWPSFIVIRFFGLLIQTIVIIGLFLLMLLSLGFSLYLLEVRDNVGALQCWILLN